MEKAIYFLGTIKESLLEIILLLQKKIRNKVYFVGSSTQGATEIAKAAFGGLRSNKGEIKELVVEVMQEVGDIQSTIKINQEIGEMQAFGASMLTHPIWTGILGLYKVIDAGIKLGVPFVLGLWTRSKFKPLASGK